MKQSNRDFSPGVSVALAADLIGKLESLITPEIEIRDKPEQKKVKKRLGEHYAEKVELVNEHDLLENHIQIFI